MHEEKNQMSLSSSLIVGWIIGLIWVVFGTITYPYVHGEIAETLWIRSVLGTWMALFITTFLAFIDSVTDGWWMRKVGENAYASAAVVCMCLYVLSAAMGLFQLGNAR